MFSSEHFFTKTPECHNNMPFLAHSSHFFMLFIPYDGQYSCLIKDCCLSLGPDDILLIHPNQEFCITRLTEEGSPCELMQLGITPWLLQSLSDSSFDLSAAFSAFPVPCTRLKTSVKNTLMIKNLIKQLIFISSDPKAPASSLYESGTATVLAVLLVRAYEESRYSRSGPYRHHLILDDIFIYIRDHISEELTLDTLSKQFYVSKYHICREFKKHTGTTLHQYILKTKLSMCRELIGQGCPVTEVYRQFGFGGYSHFFRAFKKEFHMTPKEYYRQTVSCPD